MKAYYLLAPLGAALVGCSFHTPVAVERVYTPAPTVAVTPAYVAPPNTVVMGAGPATVQVDSDGDGHSNTVDRYPHDATRY
jgi:hypothetical protein